MLFRWQLQNGPQAFDFFFICYGCQTFILDEIHCYLSDLKSWHNNLFLSGVLKNQTQKLTVLTWPAIPDSHVIRAPASPVSLYEKLNPPTAFWPSIFSTAFPNFPDKLPYLVLGPVPRTFFKSIKAKDSLALSIGPDSPPIEIYSVSQILLFREKVKYFYPKITVDFFFYLESCLFDLDPV